MHRYERGIYKVSCSCWTPTRPAPKRRRRRCGVEWLRVWTKSWKCLPINSKLLKRRHVTSQRKSHKLTYIHRHIHSADTPSKLEATRSNAFVFTCMHKNIYYFVSTLLRREHTLFIYIHTSFYTFYFNFNLHWSLTKILCTLQAQSCLHCQLSFCTLNTGSAARTEEDIDFFIFLAQLRVKVASKGSAATAKKLWIFFAELCDTVRQPQKKKIRECVMAIMEGEEL